MECDVQCGNCGAAVLGSVNRCWRCGRSFAAVGEITRVPPARLAAATSTAVPAEVLEDDETADQSPRRGSPFAEDERAASGPRGEETNRIGFATRIVASFNSVGAHVSLALGVVGVLLTWRFPLAGLCCSVLGIAAGCGALLGNRSRVAVAGLLIACVATWLSCFLAAVAVYTALHGNRPWDSFTPRP